jgi:hypothetical protein
MAVYNVSEQTLVSIQAGTAQGYFYAASVGDVVPGAQGLLYSATQDPITVKVAAVSLNRLTLFFNGLVFDTSAYGPANSSKVFFENQVIVTDGSLPLPPTSISIDAFGSGVTTAGGNLRVAIAEGSFTIPPITIEDAGYATAAAPTYVEGSRAPLSLELDGGLRVSVTHSAPITSAQLPADLTALGNLKVAISEGTISTQDPSIATAAAPTYVEGARSALSLDLAGRLRTLAQLESGTLTSITNPVSVRGSHTPSDADSNPTQNAQITAYLMGWNGFTNTWQRIGSENTNFDGEAVRTSGGALSTEAYNKVFNGATWDRLYGNVSGMFVQGPGPAGNSQVGNPLLMAGSDGNVRVFKTDAEGRLYVASETISVSATVDALNDVVGPLVFDGKQNVAFQITGTWSGEMRLQGSVDTVNWYSLECFAPSADGSEEVHSRQTANGFFQCLNPQGFTHFRVIATAWTSGSATVIVSANESAPSYYQATNREPGSTIASYGVQMGASDGTYLRYVKSDTGGNLKVRQLEAPSAGVTRVASSISNQTFLVANADRRGALIFNESTAVCYVKFGATASATSYTIAIAPSAYYEVPAWYSGQIDAVWASANGAAQVTEIS